MVLWDIIHRGSSKAIVVIKFFIVYKLNDKKGGLGLPV